MSGSSHSSFDSGDSDSDSDDNFVRQRLCKTRSSLLKVSTRCVQRLRERRLRSSTCTYGKPNIFLTLTSNATWAEVLEVIESNKSAVCPHTTTKEAHERIKTLLHQLKGRKTSSNH